MSDAPADGSVAAPPDTSSSRRQFFALVVALFCLAILFHKARLGSRDVLSHHMLVCLVALWTLLRPVSVGRFTTLMGVYLWSTLLDLPSVVNHIMFFALTAVPLAALIIAEALRARRMPAPETVFDHLGPYLRIQVVLMYAFAAFAKLNSGFFDTELSCGVVMYKALHFRNLLPQGSWTALPAIWGTVVVEVLLPVLLSLRATRIAGVFLAIGFHTTMALAGHIPFSGFSLPLLAVFLPEDLPDRFARVRLDQPLVERWSTRISALARSPMAFPGLAIAWVLLIPIPTYEFLPWFVRESVFDEGLLMVFLFLMAVVTLLLVLALRLAPGLALWGGSASPIRCWPWAPRCSSSTPCSPTSA